MGKGGLSFLNKKSWHTATIANTEKVWLAEQKDAAEKSKLAQLQKEISEERQVEELRALQRQHGIGKKQVERLDWMYRSAEVEAEIRQKEKEEFLLGKEVPSSNMIEEPTKPVAQTAVGTERWVEKYEQRDFDAESRIREDPMLQILKQEQEQRLSIIKNPLKMKRLREEIDQKKLLKRLKRMEKEEHREKQKQERAKMRSEGSRSPDHHVAKNVDKYGLIQVSHSSSSRYDRDRLHQSDLHPSKHSGQDREIESHKPHSDLGSREKERHDHNKYETKSRRTDDDLNKLRDGDHRKMEPKKRDERDRVSHRYYDHGRDPSSRQRSGSPRRRRADKGSGSDDRYYRHDRGDRRARHGDRSPRRHHRPMSPSPNSKSDPTDTPQAISDQKLLELKNRVRKRYPRHRDVASSSSSRLTAEEREEKLKSMQSDAQCQYDVRSKQLEIDMAVQEEEEAALRLCDSEAGHNAQFIQDVRRKAFMESNDTVEDRIKQRIHYRQKGSTEIHTFL